MNHLLKNCRIFNGLEFLDDLMDIEIQNGFITDISSGLNSDNEYDCHGKTVVPGYVDIHTHGISGFDNSDIKEEEFADMVNSYTRRGTTCFIPTFPTIGIKTAAETLGVYSKHRDQINCIHLEGPFINEGKKGAQNPEYILKPDLGEYIKYVGVHGDLIGRVTLSPEKDENFALTKFLVSKGILVSFGHTACSYELAAGFFEITDSLATHMFNAMPPVHHREPGITVAALMNEKTACEIIPDLIHLHPEIIKLVFRLKGPGKTVCISDSIVAAGLDEGEYVFSGLDIIVDKNSARLKSGNLAGSIITMADGVKNMVSIGITPKDAIMSATSTPARVMGIDDKAGFVKKGRKADLLILNPDYSVYEVFKNGKRIT